MLANSFFPKHVMDPDLQQALVDALPAGRTLSQQRIIQGLLVCARHLPSQLWPQFWASFVAVRSSRANASPTLLQTVIDYGDVSFIGQDSHVGDDDDQWVNASHGLLGREAAQLVKSHMFAHAWGWSAAAADVYLDNLAVCAFDDLFERKESMDYPREAFDYDMARCWTRHVARMWRAHTAQPRRGSRAVCFGAGMARALAKASERADKAIRPQDYQDRRRASDLPWQATFGLAVYLLIVRRRQSKQVCSTLAVPEAS